MAEQHPSGSAEAPKSQQPSESAAAATGAHPGEQHFQHGGSPERGGPPAGPSGAPSKPDDPRDAARQQDVKAAAERKADSDAQASIDPLRASQLAALYPGPVYYLPNQAEGNPGVQGWVFRPHQERNPGETPNNLRPREANEFQQSVSQQQAARSRQRDRMQQDAEARGEKLALLEGPARLRLSVDISANSAVAEDKMAAIASAADALVNALRDAGVDPKAGFSGHPF